MSQSPTASPGEQVAECEQCGQLFIRPAMGRPARYCSDACRQKAHRQRHTGPGQDDAARQRQLGNAWQTLTKAAITSEDVEAVVQARIARAKEQAAEIAAVARDWSSHDVGVGDPVPEPERHGKGQRVTWTDLQGFWRVRAAVITEYERRAAEPPDLDDVRETALLAMARRLNAGDEETVRSMIESAQLSTQ